MVILGAGATVDPALLEDHVHHVLRRGIDRMARLRHGARDVVAVMLAADRDGTLAFLARLERRLARDAKAAESVTYLLYEMDDPATAVPAHPDPGDYRPLDPGLEPREVTHAFGQDPDR